MGLDETIRVMSAQHISVSVIVPVYNNAHTVLRALESIVRQTAQPLEIIVVDDASTDNSCAVIEKYIQNLPIAKLLRSTRNLGPSAARNMGWAVASAEFLAFLDADDAWHHKKLETQFVFMQDNPEFMISGHQYQVVTKNEPPQDCSFEDFEVSTFNLRDFLIRNRFSTPTVMLRRSISDRFDETQRYSEDYQLWLRIIAKHKKGALIEAPLTFLFKSAYGAGGISGRMFAMYRGELANASALRRENIISLTNSLIWRTWLTIKFIIRLASKPRKDAI